MDSEGILRTRSGVASLQSLTPEEATSSLREYFRLQKVFEEFFPVWIAVIPMSEYPGFFAEWVLRTTLGDVCCIGIEYVSCIMDSYGSATHVSAQYAFDDLDLALNFILQETGLSACELAVRRPSTPEMFDGDVAAASDAWERLRADFRADLLIYPGVRLTHRFDGY